jgi:hypothetical protein
MKEGKHQDEKPHYMRRYWREILLLLIIPGSFIGMVFVPPISQSLEYHNFADRRVFLGIPNFFDVITNLPFLAFGLMGFIFCLHHRQKMAPWSWRILFLGVILVCFGSAYYHWSPNNQTLVWDRLTMAIGFMGLFVGLLSEHLNKKMERVFLVPAILIGLLSVIFWHYCDDLRFYGWVQFLPLICIPLVLLLFEGAYTHRSYLMVALALYGLAKLSEIFDKTLFSFTQEQLSGHSIKHLSAALGTYFLYFMLKHRRLRETSG